MKIVFLFSFLIFGQVFCSFKWKMEWIIFFLSTILCKMFLFISVNFLVLVHEKRFWKILENILKMSQLLLQENKI